MSAAWLRISLLATALLLLAGCGGGRVAAPVNGYSSPKTIAPARTFVKSGVMHVVRKGDTLYSIAWQYGKNVRDLTRWNAISSPDKILPGQKLRLTAPSGTAAIPAAGKVTKPAPTPAKTTPAAKPASRTVIAAAPQGWYWPVRGKLLKTFSSQDSTRNGIDIAGKVGDPVLSASSGRVVYSGNGLVGYGNLIIINHGGNYLSAYGHNRELLVREGESVKAGQLIARMGKADNDRAYLHFEIRRNGKPVDPMELLP